MISPVQIQTLSDSDAKQAKDLETYIDNELGKSPYFGVDLLYGVQSPTELKVPARIWMEVLKKYVAAGWKVEPALERGLFAPPAADKNGSTHAMITLRTAAKG